MGSRVKSALLLLLLLLQAGCIAIEKPPEHRPTPLPTPPPTTTFPDAPRVSLGEVMAALPAGAREAGIDIGEQAITKVWGQRVDSSGRAGTWVLGMQGGGRTTIISFTGGQFTELDIPATLPPGDLKTGHFLPPEEVFRKNLNTIVQEMNRLRVGECDLSLDENSYLVTIHSPGESRTLSFSATTGEPMDPGSSTL